MRSYSSGRSAAQVLLTLDVMMQLIEKARQVIIVRFTENSVEMEVKLVTHTKSVAANLTSKAVKMVDMLTSPHYHFQRWYGLHT